MPAADRTAGFSRLAWAGVVVAGLFGAGIARLYCATWERFDRRHPVLRIVLTLLMWPMVLAVFLRVYGVPERRGCIVYRAVHDYSGDPGLAGRRHDGNAMAMTIIIEPCGGPLLPAPLARQLIVV